MNRKAVIEYLGKDWERTQSLMREFLHPDVALLSQINDQLLSNSGKMLRPMICLLTASAICGATTDDTVRYAAAVEMLHNATLMHDDVTDESSERRGTPTVSAMIGPAAAVLVGDYWLARAVKVMSSSETFPQVVGLFTRTLSDLAEGEMLQLEKAGSADTCEEDYLRIIHCKTASLFEVAGSSAARSVGASEEQFKAASEFAETFGKAFQIKDDILDYVGTDTLGKPVGVDIREQKITLPLLGAMELSGRGEEMRSKMMEVKNHPEYCEEIREFVLANGGIDYAARRLDEYIEKALKVLDAFPDSQAKDYLGEIVRFNAFRQV